mmetsp:Transcript_36919/g.80422  ORF Transcript_36919/g.80422 Transcript_36919/m.80422 type:complete len:653 (-) Transcript_36919:166-2124(-)
MYRCRTVLRGSTTGANLLVKLAVISQVFISTLALDNGVGRTPVMGWNAWNFFRCDFDEKVIREVADAMVSSGLAAAGYKYVNIDDCWMGTRDENGKIQPNPTKFPSGMKALADYVHARGLKFGLYSDAGNKTCEGHMGSMGFEKEDAESYAEWEVDYLKYDFCNMQDATGRYIERPEQAYKRMRDALNATGRPIVYSLCNWGGDAVWRWGASIGNSWRTGIDLFAAWDQQDQRELALPNFLQSMMGAVRGQQALAAYAGPGAFNDPDMLLVGLDGMYPYGIVQRCPPHVPTCQPGQYITREQWGKVGGLTLAEQRTHFALWCIMASPLLLGNDPRAMTRETLDILLATEVIAVNQDPLGKQGRRVWSEGPLEIWRKDLKDHSVAVLLFNTGSTTANVTTVFERDAASEEALSQCADKNDGCADWAEHGECAKNPGYMLEACPLSCRADPVKYCGADPSADDPPEGRAGGAEARWVLVRDLWARRDVGVFGGQYTAEGLQPHGSRMLLLRRVTAQYKRFMDARTGRLGSPPPVDGKHDMVATVEQSEDSGVKRKHSRKSKSKRQQAEPEGYVELPEVIAEAQQDFSFPTPYTDFEAAVQGGEPPHPGKTFLQRLTNLHSSGGVLILENLGIVGLYLLSRRRGRRARPARRESS